MNTTQELAILKSEVGHRLKTARLENGFTQEELADRASISRSSVIALEKGRTGPRFHTLWKTSLALGMSLSDLFSGIESQVLQTGIAEFLEDAPMRRYPNRDIAS